MAKASEVFQVLVLLGNLTTMWQRQIIPQSQPRERASIFTPREIALEDRIVDRSFEVLGSASCL